MDVDQNNRAESRPVRNVFCKRLFHEWVAKGHGVPVLLLRSHLSLAACRSSLPW